MTDGPDFLKGTDGLLPAIAQDAQTLQVLMMAWMNQEAYLETLASGYATYYSRSRKKLSSALAVSKDRKCVWMYILPALAVSGN